MCKFISMVVIAALVACGSGENSSTKKVSGAAARDSEASSTTSPAQPVHLRCSAPLGGTVLDLLLQSSLKHGSDVELRYLRGLLISEPVFGFSDGNGGFDLRVFHSTNGLVGVAERGSLVIIKTMTHPSTITAIVTAIDGSAASYGPCSSI